MTTLPSPSMALIDLIFLGMGGFVMFLLHAFHPHDDHDEPEIPPAPEAPEYHPHTGLYLGIFFGLCVLTAVELVVPWAFHSFFSILVFLLMVLAFAKAGLVGVFFMHLKDEHWSVFVALGCSVAGIMLMLAGIIWDISVIYGVGGH